MSAKPATIYLGTRSQSHYRRRPGHPKGQHQEGRYRSLIKGRSAFKAEKKPGRGTEAVIAIRRYHHHQLSVKKVVKLTNQVGKSNLAKKLSGSSTPSVNSNKVLNQSTQQRKSENQKKMTTSVLHLPATPATTPAAIAVTDLDTIGCPRGTTTLKQQQNTSSSSSSLPSTANSLAQNSTNTAKVVGSIPSATTNVKPGLPSPSSTSETSDYQRSTPSPNAGNEDQLRSLGTTEIDWSQNTHPCNEHRMPINGSRDAKLQIQNRQIISNQNPQKIQNNNRRKSTSSLIQNNSMMLNTSGISNNVVNVNPNKCASENNREQPISTSNSNLVLQQLRVALKKLPEAKLNSASLKPIEAVKRRHSDCGLISNLFNSNGLNDLPSEVIGVKKAKLYQQQPHHRRPLSASVHSKGQGKITAYLPEMKHFIALRKEKLDRVLNLAQAAPKKVASEKHKQQLTTSGLEAGLDEACMQDISSTNESGKKEQSQIQQSPNYESGIDTGSNDTASVASSGSRHSISSGISSHRGGDQDQDVFEVPRTIRFPPAAPTKCYSEVVICKWELCGNEFDSTGKLLDHLKSIHAVAENQKEETDNSSEDSNSIQYKCLWEGCKVYGKGSSSKLWLEKHVMSHGGNKPFQCIVDGCKHRFGTQSLLERHVNNHFKNKESPSGAVSTTTTSGETGSVSGKSGSTLSSASRSSASNQSTGGSSCSSKVFRKLVGKRIKYRKTVYSARIFDHFDIGAMAQVRMRLSEYEKKCQEWKSAGFFENPHLQKDPTIAANSKVKANPKAPQTNSSDQVVILHSKIIARKTDLQGNLKVLQSWNPPNILEDQWILAKDVVPTQSVKMSSLPLSIRVQLTNQLYNFPSTSSTPRRGRKLKPQPRSTALS